MDKNIENELRCFKCNNELEYLPDYGTYSRSSLLTGFIEYKSFYVSCEMCGYSFKIIIEPKLWNDKEVVKEMSKKKDTKKVDKKKKS